MEIKILTTVDQLIQWDDFVVEEPRGNHLQLSDWLKSYESYGFSWEVVAATHNGKIIGGYGAVLAKSFLFKFYILPCGPIMNFKSDHKLEVLIKFAVERAKKLQCCSAQLTLPFCKDFVNSHSYNQLPNFSIFDNARKGHIFKYVYSLPGLNWVNFTNYIDPEQLINEFKPSLRRNIRNSYRKGLKLKMLQSECEILEAYTLFEENARDSNYNIRLWANFRITLLALVEKKFVIMPAVYKDGVIKGALLLIKSGGYYSYVMGGSKKEKPDLRTGDFLQWEAICLSFVGNFDGYNISLGGSKGVVEFKNSFNAQQLTFNSGKFYWVLKPYTLKFYITLEMKLRPYKVKISKILGLIEKLKS